MLFIKPVDFLCVLRFHIKFVPDRIMLDPPSTQWGSNMTFSRKKKDSLENNDNDVLYKVEYSQINDLFTICNYMHYNSSYSQLNSQLVRFYIKKLLTLKFSIKSNNNQVHNILKIICSRFINLGLQLLHMFSHMSI